MFGSSQTLTFGAGGYSQDVGASQMQSSTPEKKARTEDKQNCVPVTARIISDAVAKRAEGSSEIQIHGVEVANVVLVGVVEKLSQQTTALEFTLNDGSGRIKVRHYHNNGSETAAGIKAGEYVVIVGGLRVLPQLHISALSLRPAQGADEVSYHMIEVVHSALQLRRKDESSSKDLATPASKAKPVVEASPPKAMEVEAAPSSTPPPVANPAPAATSAPPLKGQALKEKLIEILRAKAPEEGMSPADLMSELKHTVAGGESEIKGALLRMVEDGDAFEPLDDGRYGVF